MLMAAVFPAAVLDREYGAAITPFQLRGFYATPPFEQLFLADDGTFHGRMNIEPSTLNAMRLLREIRRAVRLRISTSATSVSPAPQARASIALRGDWMSL